MDSTLDFGFRFSHFRNTNVSQNYSTSLTKHTRNLFLPFESLNHREDWKERGICHQKFPLVDVSKLRLSFVWKSTTDMFWRWNEEPKDQNYVWQYHSKIIPRSLKEKNMNVSREIVTRERPTRVTESSNSCFLRYITSVFNNPALWDFSVDTFGLSRITHAGRFTHSRRKKWVFTNSRMKCLLFTHHAWMSFHEFTQQKKGF